jgi:small subunit ribosomal protein S11
MGKKRVIQKGGDTKDAASSSARGTAKSQKNIAHAVVNIRATYNNTLISIADHTGNVLAWSTSGAMRFSGAKKATPFAAARVVESVLEKTRRMQFQDVAIRVSGVGAGRDSAIRAIANHGLNIVSIVDVTPAPHNGPRSKKVRRV